MKSSNVFITGCDSNGKWMLPWFEANFRKHNPNARLLIFDFDRYQHGVGWFKKPGIMVEASKLKDVNKVVWLDTDIEVRANIEDIFDKIEPNKLLMGRDDPWTKRRGEAWHNSGVVGFQGTPKILSHWAEWCNQITIIDNAMVGDQDVLHAIVREELTRLTTITDLPKSYNTLRLDLLDKTAPKNIKLMHWTGKKGKEEIRRLWQK